MAGSGRGFSIKTLNASETCFDFPVPQPPDVLQNWYCIQSLQLCLSFRNNELACKLATWLTSYLKNTNLFLNEA